MSGRHDAFSGGDEPRPETGSLVLGEVRAALTDLVSTRRERRHRAPRPVRVRAQPVTPAPFRPLAIAALPAARPADADPAPVLHPVPALTAPALPIAAAAPEAEAYRHRPVSSRPSSFGPWIDDVFTARVRTRLPAVPVPPRTTGAVAPRATAVSVPPRLVEAPRAPRAEAPDVADRPPIVAIGRAQVVLRDARAPVLAAT